MSTKSGRKQIIGAIDSNKPRIFLKQPRNVDTRRILRTDDIDGARPFYKRSVKPQEFNGKFKQVESLIKEGKSKIALTSRRENNNDSYEVSPDQQEHLIEINKDIILPAETLNSMRNQYSAYRNRSRQIKAIVSKNKSDNLINFEKLKSK